MLSDEAASDANLRCDTCALRDVVQRFGAADVPLLTRRRIPPSGLYPSMLIGFLCKRDSEGGGLDRPSTQSRVCLIYYACLACVIFVVY